MRASCTKRWRCKILSKKGTYERFQICWNKLWFNLFLKFFYQKSIALILDFYCYQDKLYYLDKRKISNFRTVIYKVNQSSDVQGRPKTFESFSVVLFCEFRNFRRHKMTKCLLFVNYFESFTSWLLTKTEASNNSVLPIKLQFY